MTRRCAEATAVPIGSMTDRGREAVDRRLQVDDRELLARVNPIVVAILENLVPELMPD